MRRTNSGGGGGFRGGGGQCGRCCCWNWGRGPFRHSIPNAIVSDTRCASNALSQPNSQHGLASAQNTRTPASSFIGPHNPSNVDLTYEILQPQLQQLLPHRWRGTETERVIVFEQRRVFLPRIGHKHHSSSRRHRPCMAYVKRGRLDGHTVAVTLSSLTQSLTHSLTPSLTHARTHARTHSICSWAQM